MTPLSFDHDTAREMCGDDDARFLEAKARADADKETYAPPAWNSEGSYWSQVQDNMRRIVYRVQYTKRKERNERKASGDRPEQIAGA